ncbi:hypothetical protein ACFQL7_20835 [Halocatena marina]|uniref:Uncharacterized protein n=1 Tax=Halocatena marina TaxID=2934937 RepID=A0ABD5YRQ0_9EURY|nr:hypothetical protein [Halocatena marina]
MIISHGPGISGGGSGNTFLISGPATFGPFYTPKRISVEKERNLDKSDNFCGSQDITDTGSKNRVLHVAGRLRQSELSAFHAVLDSNKPFNILSPVWSGEIRIENGDVEGPTAIDPIDGQFLFEYSLDVVSTGVDEDQGSSEFGVVSGPTPSTSSTTGVR